MMILLTLGAYLFSRRLCLRYQNPWLNVVAVSSALVIAILLIFHIPYEMYQPGKDLISILLGPATVCLAVPLYNHRAVVKKHLVLIIGGVCLASALTSLIAMGIVQWLGLPRDVVISIGPKSATAPIAVEVARVNGGDPGLAVAFVVATGTLGAVLGPALLTFLKITNPVIRGLAMGTVSHGQGTAVALLEGEQQGMMAGIGMALSALVTSGFIPIIVPILLSC